MTGASNCAELSELWNCQAGNIHDGRVLANTGSRAAGVLENTGYASRIPLLNPWRRMIFNRLE